MTLTIQDDMTVDSRVIADGCGIEHKAVMQLLETHKAVMEEEFGIVPFQMEKIKGSGRGRSERFAVLDEDQTTFLITLMRNTRVVVRFKAALTKAFSRAKQLLAERQGVPTWKDARLEAATSFRLQSRAISDARLNAGKDVKPHHFMCEAKLINWTLKGEFKGINRDGLTAFDLSALRELQVANTFFIMKGWDYERRKAELPRELAKFRAKFQKRLADSNN